MHIHRFSEPYAATGNIGDSGITKLLGTPDLDLLQTVLRESVQNCCDAAKLDTGPIIQLRFRTLDAQASKLLKDNLLTNHPQGPSSAAQFAALKSLDRIPVLEICDFGTTGLAGPTRADRMPKGIRYTDFIDFFRNVGTRRNSALGGGTYGFGKISLYLLSRCSTILVDSQTLYMEKPVRRVMACHLGDAFDSPNGDGTAIRHTGRHWWGVQEDETVEPLSGDKAIELSKALDMPERDVSRSGTSIMILDPRLDERSMEDSADKCVEQLLWNFWPRMTRDTPSELKIDITVECEGKTLDVPIPENFPPLDLYAKAMAKIRSNDANVEIIASERPRKILGECYIEKGFRSSRRSKIFQDSALPNTNAAIALMRPACMVVRYLQGNALPNERFEWAGVFIVDKDQEVEAAFASAEPPAHDDWNPGMLETGRAKSFVNIAMRKLKERARNVPSEFGVVEPMSTTDHTPLADIATILGNFLSTEGNNPVKPSKRKTGTKGKRLKTMQPTVSDVQFECLETIENTKQARFSVSLSIPENFTACLVINASPIIDGLPHRSRDGDGIEQPVVLSVSDDKGLPLDQNAPLPPGEQTICIRTSIPDGAATGVMVSIEAFNS